MRRSPARHPLTALFLSLALALGAAACSQEHEKTLEAAPDTLSGEAPIVETFEAVAEQHDVPIEVLVGVAWVESRFATEPTAPSELGGHGMMRLTEGRTLERAAALTGIDVETLRTDPAANLEGAAAVLAALYDETGNWNDALAAYGPGHVDAEAGAAYTRRVIDVARDGAAGVDSAGRTIVFGGASRDVFAHDVAGERYATIEQAARPDYSGARWEGPVCSGNYTNASRGAPQITDIVIHTCQGGFSGCWGWLKNCESGVSAHYVVSSGGEVVQIVEEQDIAYHDACFNTNSIGIEHEGFIDDPGRWYTEEMYCESAKLVRSICDRNNIPCDRAHVRGHDETPDCSTHTDPGSGWDWNKYMEYIECGCGGCCQASTEVCNGSDDDCDGDVDEGDVCEARLLHNQIGAYATPSTTDVDGDGKADVCGRGAAGVWCHFARSGAWSPRTDVRPAWSDDNGWDDVSNYATFRMGDVNGDGHADLCARANAGVHCHLGSPTGLDGDGSGLWRDGYEDAGGWNRPRYYTTFRLADVDGDGMEDLCARSASRFACRLSDGTGFGTNFPGPELSDDLGWGRARNYGTIRMGDIDGDGRDDLCARANAGMRCWLAEDAGFAGSAITGPAWNNASGWDRMSQWSTVRLADANGDGMDDLCGRSADGLECAFSNGAGFEPAIQVAGWADDNGWGDMSNYATLRVGDIDGDGSEDFCARADAGVRCRRWDGGGFVGVTGPSWSDDSGWDAPAHYHTLTLADVDGDGMDDICARAAAGWRCALSEGDAFGPVWTLDEFTNDSGWRAAKYRRTLLSAGPECRPIAEVCNGEDDDCDGEVDEDDVCITPPEDIGDTSADTPDMVAGDTATPPRDTGGPSLSDAPLLPDGGTSGDGVGAEVDAGGTDGTSSSDGCGCRTIRRASRGVDAGSGDASRLPGIPVLLLGLALFWARRRRCRGRD